MTEPKLGLDYQLYIDGEPAAPRRTTWRDAAHDAVDLGCAWWEGADQIKIYEYAHIERLPCSASI